MTGDPPSAENKVIAALLRRMRSRRQLLSEQPSEQLNNPHKPALQREADSADYAAIAALKAKCGLRADSPENWQRLWHHNPALAPGRSRCMGWVLEADGQIVGYLGNIARLYQYGATPEGRRRHWPGD